MIETYTPSGRCSARIIPATTAALLPTVLLAGLYQLLSSWIPVLIISALLTVALAAGVALIASAAGRAGRNRSRVVAWIMGAILSGAAIVTTHYIDYRQHRSAFVEAALADAAASGHTTLADLGVQFTDVDASQIPITAETVGWFYVPELHVENRVEAGWSIGDISSERNGMPVTGIMVYVVWLIEAGIVLVGAVVAAVAQTREPYDEAAGGWMKQTIILQTAATPDECLRIAQAENLETLLALPQGSGPLTLRYKLASSVCDGEPAYLSVEAESTVLDEKQQPQTQKVDLHTRVMLPASQAVAFVKRVLDLETSQDATTEEQPSEAAEALATDAPSASAVP